MRKISVGVLILALLVVSWSSVIQPAHAAPTLTTDLPLYTQRDKQVTLTGSGYAANQIYYVWQKTPQDNSTHYTGTSFAPTSTGLIPPAIGLPIGPDSALGTYLLSMSTSSSVDDSQSRAHYGIWGPTTPLYQRTQSVMIFGGGLFPGTSFRLNIRDPAGNFVHQTTPVSTADGNFNTTWRIPEDALTDAYTIFIDGTGTFDDAQQDYFSASKFSVTTAVLSATIVEQPAAEYQRTERAKVTFGIKYPDGTPVVKSKADIHPVVLLLNQTAVAYTSLTVVDQTSGIWEAETKLLENATLSPRYRFQLPAMSFDDGFDNKGGLTDILSGNFEVRNATLQISSEVNGTQIQVPFGQVSIISRVTYPDGSPLTNGTVWLMLSAGPSTTQLGLAYDSNISAWRTAYQSSLSDLWKVGTWTLNVAAEDKFGNSGVASYEVSAQPFLFLGIIALLVLVALLARWTVSRFGRRAYLRVRKLSQRLRR